MINLVVWDWNGTLFDDIVPLVEAVNHSSVPLHGISPITVEHYQEIYEVPLKKVFKKVGVSNEEFKELSARRSELFLREYEPLAVHVPLRTGAESTLSFLQGRDVTQIILSNHTTEGIYQQLARLDITPYFETVLANDAHEYVHTQGKHHRLASFMQTHSFAPQETLIVGDTLEEIDIARDLGIKSATITDGYCSEERLKDSHPDYLIHSLDELTTLWRG